MNERDMLNLLHERYSHIRRGTTTRRYVVAEHVRADVGYGVRTADFVAQDCYLSAGLHLHGHEVKVSRSDWLSELKDMAKSHAVKRYCDRWWLVASNKAVVKDDLPDDWGLLVPGRSGKLRAAKMAPLLNPEPRPVRFEASLMRSVARTARRPI